MGIVQPNTARKLWLGLSILAFYVSIYPANFGLPVYHSAAYLDLFSSCCGRPGRGDVLGNVVLFIPFGFLGMLAARRSSGNVARGLYVVVVAVLFALALQVFQVYLPTRDANLQDVLWNLLGTLAAIPFGAMARKMTSDRSSLAGQFALAPLLLIAAWLSYRLIPFVPSIDFQGIKDSLKPLLLVPELSAVRVVHDAVAWSLVAMLARLSHRNLALDNYLPVLMLVTFALEVVIVANDVSASNVLGAALGMALWFVIGRRMRHGETALAVALVVMLLLVGLAPFALRDNPIAFNWLPFHGFLRGSMYINSQSACEKFFLYGTLVFLLWRIGFSRMAGVVAAMAVVTLVEISQTRLVGHTPELTDVIIVAIAALLLTALDPGRSADSNRTPAGPPRPPRW